jgi:hypothetical protein
MRVAVSILLALFFTAATARAQEQLPTLKVGSRIYHNVTILSISPTDVLFNSDDGMANAKLKNLDPELQKHFHYHGLKPEPAEPIPLPPVTVPPSAPTPLPTVQTPPVPTPLVAAPAPTAAITIAPAVAKPAPAAPAATAPAPTSAASVAPAPTAPPPVAPVVSPPTSAKPEPVAAEPVAAQPAKTVDVDRENTTLIMEDAIERVKAIVNQPVKELSRTPDMKVTIYHPGWFHRGAIKPDFNTVDVRKTQETRYGNYQYVTSDLNPGVVFVGADLEFNPMTKYFYEDRSLPKKKLTEEEMLEVNRLYRVLGKCEGQLK